MFEISEIRHAQWNDPGHRAFGYCNCKQDTEEQFWGQKLCQMKGTFHSHRPPEILMTGKVKFDYFQKWSQILRWDRTKTGPSYLPFLTKISGILGWMESASRWQWESVGLTKSMILVVKSWKLIHSLAMNLFLAIADLPRITDITTPPILKTGENVNLSCIASGLSLLNVTWLRGQNVVSNHGNSTSTVVIRLFNITQEDWGEYTCVTQNAAGEDRRTVFLRS